MSNISPEEIVHELDKHIVGQQEAKRSVAIALRNRWRRSQVEENLRNEITPKKEVTNILLLSFKKSSLDLYNIFKYKPIFVLSSLLFLAAFLSGFGAIPLMYPYTFLSIPMIMLMSE